MEAKISIIIPAYNAAEFLPACLDSVMNQSLREIEIIIVDDGSTDSTQDISDRYAQSDSRISVIHKANAGVSEARNTGIACALGEYFWFVDSDDIVTPGACEELYNLAKENDTDAVIFDYSRIKEGVDCGVFTSLFPRGTYEDDDVITEIIQHFLGFSNDGIRRWCGGEPNGLYVENPALWRTLLRGDLIRNNNLRFDPSLKVGEDTIFLSLCLSYSGRAEVTHNVYYCQRLHDTSTVAKYEKNPEVKLENKLALLAARLTLTEDILQRRGIDVKVCWQGTVIMSYMELCFMFARPMKESSFNTRYRQFLSYGKDPRVKESILKFVPLRRLSIKALPFWLMRRRLHRVLFFCATILNCTGFKFERE